ncbi:unnamed protein product [Brugia timori]|uniref:Uncharacterized protein n=1 Tax=Brugia timori TaxID=42155 RepID=A0A3P7T133_9BILA|nr:unnamed protein product [Brugia timori]
MTSIIGCFTGIFTFIFNRNFSNFQNANTVFIDNSGIMDDVAIYIPSYHWCWCTTNNTFELMALSNYCCCIFQCFDKFWYLK